MVDHTSCGCPISEVSNSKFTHIQQWAPHCHCFSLPFSLLSSQGTAKTLGCGQYPQVCADARQEWPTVCRSHSAGWGKEFRRKTKGNEPRPCPSWGAGTGTIQLFWVMIVKEQQEMWFQQQGLCAASVPGSALMGSPPPSTRLMEGQNSSLCRVNKQSKLFQVDWNDLWYWAELVTPYLLFGRGRGLEEFRKLSLEHFCFEFHF